MIVDVVHELNGKLEPSQGSRGFHLLPLILRGVRPIGTNANGPMPMPLPLREINWRKLARDYRPRHLDRIAKVLPLDELPAAMARWRERATRGRTVIAMD